MGETCGSCGAIGGPPPVPLVYAPDIITATQWDTDDEMARVLASMATERRARFLARALGIKEMP